MPEVPAQKARETIDSMLAAAGWVIQDSKAFDPSVSTVIALREVPLRSGRCDYLPLAMRRPVDILEANDHNFLESYTMPSQSKINPISHKSEKSA